MALDRLNIEAMALSPAPGGEATAECPFCGARKGHFYVNPVKGVYYCHKCGASGRVSDGLPRIPQARPVETALTAGPDRLDAVYRVLLRVLSLSEKHLKHLLTVRGFSEERVRQNGYRTLPHGERLRIAERVAARLDPAGVPGFYRSGDTWVLGGCPGLLIPVKDFEGRVVGCQIRTFEPDLPKYVWLSSVKHGGAGATTRFHVVYGSKDPRNMWLTEGPLKADISGPRLGRIVVAVPGVTALRPALVSEMVGRGCRNVILAFDSDVFTNQKVAAAVNKALAMLDGAGLTLQVATWPCEHKGLDDLLLAGKHPKLAIPRRHSTVNRVFVSGYVKKVSVGDANAKDDAKLRKMTMLVDDPEGQPIPVLAFSNVAVALEKQNPEPGDWLEAEGHVRSWAGKYGELSTNVVLSAARVLKKVQPAWWDLESISPVDAARKPQESPHSQEAVQ